MANITLTISGHEFNLLALSYKFHRDVDLKGRPETQLRNGFLFMTMESTESTFLFEQFVTKELNTKPFAGKIEVLMYWDETVVRRLVWKEAYIIRMSEEMDCFSTKSMITKLMVSPIDLIIDDRIYFTRHQDKTNGFWVIDPEPAITPMRSVNVSSSFTSSLQKNEREPDVVRVFWKSRDIYEERKDMMLNHRIKLQIQLSNYIAGDYVQLVVKQSKGRRIKGNSTQFTISGRCDEKGLIVLPDFKVDCDFKEDNQDFEKIEFYYKGRLVETFDENFGWWYINEGGITKIFVMLEPNISYLAPGCTGGDYQNAIQEQFKRTLEISSEGKVTGKIFFTCPFTTLEPPQVTIGLNVVQEAAKKEKKDGEVSVEGATSFNKVESQTQTVDDGLLLMNLGEISVHELLHTLRIDHPQTTTQGNDSKIISVSGVDFKTTPATNPNIYYNIMTYNFLRLDGKLLSDLWKNKRPEYLTKGQLRYMIEEIDRQKNGDGSSKAYHAYDSYWATFPGEEIILNKKEN